MMFRRVLKLDHLRDVVVQSPQNNQVLKYNGIYWVNDFVNGGGGGGTGDIVKIAEWEMDSDVIIYGEPGAEEVTITEQYINFDFNTYRFFIMQTWSLSDSLAKGGRYANFTNDSTFRYNLYLSDSQIYPIVIQMAQYEEFWFWTDYIYLVKQDTQYFYAWYVLASATLLDDLSVVDGNFIAIATNRGEVVGIPNKMKFTGQWVYSSSNYNVVEFGRSLFRVYGYK